MRPGRGQRLENCAVNDLGRFRSEAGVVALGALDHFADPLGLFPVLLKSGKLDRAVHSLQLFNQALIRLL